MKAIVAVDQHWAIGKGGDQLCYISADLKRFKAITSGHPVILGRKTLSTFPGGKPLPKRRNLILSRNPNFQAEGGEVYPNLTALLAQAPEDSFVIGGASVYKSLLSRCDEVYVTKIAHTFSDPDAFFPDLDADPAWEIAQAEEPMEDSGYTFQYVTYRRA